MCTIICNLMERSTAAETGEIEEEPEGAPAITELPEMGEGSKAESYREAPEGPGDEPAESND